MTGVGCYGFGKTRVHVVIPDFFIPEQFVPSETLDSLIFQQVLKYGTIKGFVENHMHRDWDKGYHQIVTEMLCRARFEDDPEFAMYMNDRIVDKLSGNLIPFRLRYAQRKLLGLMEDLRHARQPIYIILLKARQWGGSTLVQMYIKWMQDYRHPNGWNAIVLSQVIKTSRKIKAMYRKAIENQPGWTLGLPGKKLKMAPFEGSGDDFIVTDGVSAIRSATLSVASFENFDNIRGDNFHCAHYSEVAYWKKTPEHDPEAVISSVSGGMLGLPDDIEVFESTGNGTSGFFYDKCQVAMDPKNNDAYKFLFIPFFLIENDMKPTGEKGFTPEQEEQFATWLWENRNKTVAPEGYREEGKFFWKMWKLGACFEAINWYRQTRNRHKTHAYMASEAPIDPVEAFRNSGRLVFDQYAIDELRDEGLANPIFYADIILPPFQHRSKTVITNSKIFPRDDKTGEMKVWASPNNHILKIKNRYVVSVDIGGVSNSADYTVMTVLDCKGLIPELHGKLEVVARWRGHCRHDILAWKAAALAHYYDDALLVIESNTADREKDNNTEGDHFGTIIEEISNYYNNLYIRSKGAESVKEDSEMKYGFQTNKLTKGWIIDNLIAFVDDKLWIEHDENMFSELRIYERKEDGTMGNKAGSGKHDDIIMSTAIALWVALNDMDKPAWIIQQPKDTFIYPREVTAATI
jgi:hypothetical protein